MNNLRVSDRFFLGLWMLILLLTPFYLLGNTPVSKIRTGLQNTTQPVKVEGGVPQIADLVLVGLIALVVAGIGVRVPQTMLPVVACFAAFTVYVLIVNSFWAILTEDLSLLINSLFYVFNFMVFLAFLTLYSRCGDALLHMTIHGIAASVFLQVVLSPLAAEGGWVRQKLFFNNENQLGYFALLAGTVFFLGSRHFHVSLFYQACFYLAVLYLTALSLSVAALIALAVLFVLIMLDRPLSLAVAGFALGTIFLVSLILPGDFGAQILANIEARLTKDHVHDSLAKRGYDRLLNHPNYVFFGAGEGAYYRFLSEFHGELHSSIGTLLFCYGVVGMLLFGAALLWLCGRSRLMSLVWISPLFVYGLAHQGLRFRLFWVLLAFLCCLTKAGERFATPDARPASASGPEVLSGAVSLPAS